MKNNLSGLLFEEHNSQLYQSQINLSSTSKFSIAFTGGNVEDRRSSGLREEVCCTSKYRTFSTSGLHHRLSTQRSLVIMANSVFTSTNLPMFYVVNGTIHNNALSSNMIVALWSMSSIVQSHPVQDYLLEIWTIIHWSVSLLIKMYSKNLALPSHWVVASCLSREYI